MTCSQNLVTTRSPLTYHLLTTYSPFTHPLLTPYSNSPLTHYLLTRLNFQLGISLIQTYSELTPIFPNSQLTNSLQQIYSVDSNLLGSLCVFCNNFQVILIADNCSHTPQAFPIYQKRFHRFSLKNLSTRNEKSIMKSDIFLF